MKPEEFIERINEAVRGWVNYFQHTNASEAFRRLQRFINLRVRRYLSQRHREGGSGGGATRTVTLYAMGVIYIGSGRVRYATNAVG